MEEALKIVRAYMSLGEEYQGYVVKAVPSQLDRVWAARLNTICETRDGHGRRVYIFRLGGLKPYLKSQCRLPVETPCSPCFIVQNVSPRSMGP